MDVWADFAVQSIGSSANRSKNIYLRAGRAIGAHGPKYRAENSTGIVSSALPPVGPGPFSNDVAE